MTRNQAKRIALLVEALYIIKGAQTDCVTDTLGDSDCDLFRREQRRLAFRWLKEAGFSETPESLEVGIAEILKN